MVKQTAPLAIKIGQGCATPFLVRGHSTTTHLVIEWPLMGSVMGLFLFIRNGVSLMITQNYYKSEPHFSMDKNFGYHYEVRTLASEGLWSFDFGRGVEAKKQDFWPKINILKGK